MVHDFLGVGVCIQTVPKHLGDSIYKIENFHEWSMHYSQFILASLALRIPYYILQSGAHMTNTAIGAIHGISVLKMCNKSSMSLSHSHVVPEVKYL